MTREEQIAIIKEHIDYLEGLKKTADDLFDKEQADRDIESFKAAIQALEEQKTGHWIKYQEPWGGIQEWECSNCKNHYDVSSVYKIIPYNFCPNCGAKMEDKE